MIHLYPYIEQTNIFNAFNFSLTLPYGITWYDNANSLYATSPTWQAIGSLYCPSDGLSGFREAIIGGGFFSRSNYLGFFGNLNYGSMWQTPANPLYRKAAFALNYGAKFADFLDGTSNTVVLGEYLTGTGTTNDNRGIYWSDQPGYSQLYTQNSPNSSIPDFIYNGYCFNFPNLNLPCLNSNGGGNDTVVSRSRHPGGVNILFGDASVHFVKNSINIATWQALGSINGAEVISSDSY
jgi:prepilin-type processing-associated H-X9-DG protein